MTATVFPRSVHSHWGIYGVPGQLPEVIGSPNLNPNLQQGDIAYVLNSAQLYQCDSNALGNAIWSPVGGGGTNADLYTSKIIVGCATNGDTINECTILDPGDGSGIQQALGVAANFATPCDVFIRAGVYDFTANVIAPYLDFTNLVIGQPACRGIRVTGAGRDATKFIVPFNSIGVYFGGEGNQLSDLTVTQTTSGAPNNLPGDGVITIAPLAATGPAPLAWQLRNIRIELNMIDSGSTTIGGVDFWGPNSDYADGNIVEDVVVIFTGQLSDYNPVSTGNPLSNSFGFRGLTFGVIKGVNLLTTFTRCYSYYMETGFCANDYAFFMQDCEAQSVGMLGTLGSTVTFVGFFSTDTVEDFECERCRVLGTEDAITGFFRLVTALATTDSGAWFNCYVDADLADASVGYLIQTDTGGTQKAYRVQGNEARRCVDGFILDVGTTQNQVQNNNTIGCTTPITDLGSVNDVAHFQAT